VYYFFSLIVHLLLFYHWAKSHQDDKVYIIKEIPVDAYLNAEADELATTGLKLLQEKPECQWIQKQQYSIT
jgi:hypothetical protein